MARFLTMELIENVSGQNVKINSRVCDAKKQTIKIEALFTSQIWESYQFSDLSTFKVENFIVQFFCTTNS